MTKPSEKASSETTRGSDILAFSVSYHNHGDFPEFVRLMRASAGCWFDHFVCLGAPSSRVTQEAQELLDREDRLGIQYLKIWKENRGQHHAMVEAMRIAKLCGYKWLLRLDPDVRPRTKRWLSKMVQRLEEIKTLVGDQYYRLVASPRVVGLRNPLVPMGRIEKGQKFPVDVMPVLGGACRLHPVELIEDFQPSIYSPLGRGDPQAMGDYLLEKTAGGMLVRFPDIRVVHRTDDIECKDSPEASLYRKMSHYWPWLGQEV